MNSDQNTAIAQQQSQGFRSLEVDVQNLILKIAKGYTRVEQLVSIEAQATRDAITTHVTSELKAWEIKNISDNQRQRLLKSLKPEEIRERYNTVLPSSDACFERVFASFERVCRNEPGCKAQKGCEQAFGDHGENDSNEKVDEVDLIWECFSTWLQSDDELFWIRGKPGSGKSTLIKFVIENDNTKRLLGFRHPSTKILSHFFWKIGSEPQNSIRGLSCSLLYDLLSEDNDAIDKVLKEFKFSQSKDFYKEWSSQEAEKVLCCILDVSAYPICIFVDGLDEVSDKDGYQALLGVVQKLTTCRGVKVCVSSRPETELIRRLENIGVQNLRLEDLTKPEMAVYLQREFEKLPKEQSADLPLWYFTENLLEKAQGVFLWLALALKNVTNGMMNGDDQETLSRRLEELPRELEALYQTMWERMNGNNRVYRETAARYFRFAMADCWPTGIRKRDGLFYGIMKEPSLDQLSLVVKAQDRLVLPSQSNEIKMPELDILCAATESDIQTRCAGMLQVGRHSDLEDQDYPDAIYPLTRPVQFIHRTAHDFLVDTEAGQSIMNYGSNETTLVDEDLKLLECRLNLANTYYRELEVVSLCRQVFSYCNRLLNKGANPEAILAILRTIKGLHESGALELYHYYEQSLSFPCAAAYRLVNFDDFIISSFMATPSPEFATNSLYELALASQHTKMSETSVRIIRGLIELGGNAHVAKRSTLPLELPGHEMRTAQHTTAFESLLVGAFNPPQGGDRYNHIRSFLGVVESLVQTCPDLHRRFILFLGKDCSVVSYKLWEVELWLALEVDLLFLINQLLASADSENIPTGFRIRQLAVSSTRPHFSFRHIVRREEVSRTYCYRILDQESCLDIIDHLFYSREYEDPIRALENVLDAVHDPIDGSTYPQSSLPPECFKEVPIEEEMDMLIQEGIGLYREEDVNIG